MKVEPVMNKSRLLRCYSFRCLFIVGALWLLAPAVNAQFNSSVQGTVQDASQAVIQSASVRLRNVETNATQQTTTNESGYYRFSSLQPGEYEVTTEAQGFAVKTQAVTVSTGQNRDLNFSVEPQGTTATVDVTAEAPLLDTAENRVQLTLPARVIRDLPLRNNNIFQIMALAPGVVGTNGASDNFFAEGNSGISANGRSARGNSFNVDGLNVTSNITNGSTNLLPNPDTIQELNLETNTFRADQGLGSSLVVNVITKSGTNDFHGSLTGYYTDQRLRARTSLPFIERYAPFSRKNLSGAIGGPVYLPRFGEGGPALYNGRNKTFFFFAVERLRARNATTSVETYESQEFVNFAQQNFPNTIGTRVLTDYPADGPVRTNVLQTAAQYFGTGTTGCGTAATANISCTLPVLVQGTWNRSPFRNGLQYNLRGDQYIGSKDRIYASFIRAESSRLIENLRTPISSTGETLTNSVQANWTHTFGPRLINEFSISGNKVEGTDGVGAPFRIPSIGISGSAGTGVGFGGTFIQHNYNFRDVVTLVKGNHTLKFGGTYFTGDDFADFPNANSRPNFSFNSLLDLVRDQPLSGGYGAYDPLTGQPNSYQFGAEVNGLSAFAQDEWKTRPNLTLTLSLRWDDFGNPQAINNFRMTNLFVAAGDTVDQITPNAAVRQLEKPFNGRLNKNFSPRFGFAYSPGASGRTSLRGGVGLYYDWITLGEVVDRVNGNPPNFLFPSFGPGQPLQPIFTIGSSDDYPYGFTRPGIAAASLDARGGIVGLNSNIGGLDPNLTPPKSINYAVGIEHQFFGRTVVGLNYTGSKMWDGLVGGDYNRLPGDLLDGTLNRLNPSFGSIQYIVNSNESRYNALITSVRTDIGRSGSFQASYTLSNVKDYYQGGSRSVNLEGIDDVRLIKERYADANFDARHRFSASGIYTLPTPFASNFFARNVLGGWEIGSTAILQTGTPYSIFNNAPFRPIRDAAGNITGLQANSGDYNADGNNFEYPNQIDGVPQIGERSGFLAGQAFYSRSQFPNPAVGTAGNSLRNYFRQQGFIGVDASLIKNIGLGFLGDSGNLQLKAEFFNVINRVNLGGMRNNTDDSLFGRIVSQGEPRVIQVGARFAF